MRLVMAGSSGFLGTQLRHRLAADGHQVIRLVRRPAGAPDEVSWDPATHTLDPAVLSGQDIVINLAGAGVGDRRWTEAYKQQIRTSRVDATATLAAKMAKVPPTKRPAALLNASAVGWYGNTGDRTMVEDAPAGDGFFADVCREWEEATGPAEDAAVRVVRLRTGLVLDARGGFLKQLRTLFAMGAGGRMGTGQQYMPWIALHDWVEAVRFLIDHETVSGPVNLTSPRPVTNAEFSRSLGRVMHRPAVLPVPRTALRLAIGEFADDALSSQRILPGVLTREGFKFRYPDIEPALRAALHTDTAQPLPGRPHAAP